MMGTFVYTPSYRHPASCVTTSCTAPLYIHMDHYNNVNDIVMACNCMRCLAASFRVHSISRDPPHRHPGVSPDAVSDPLISQFQRYSEACITAIYSRSMVAPLSRPHPAALPPQRDASAEICDSLSGNMIRSVENSPDLPD